MGINDIPRRFYATDTRNAAGWSPVLIPTPAERDAEGSLYRPNAVAIPDLGSVTDAERERVVGL